VERLYHGRQAPEGDDTYDRLGLFSDRSETDIACLPCKETAIPTNHGIYRKLPTTPGKRITTTEAMVFRYGILQIFQALKTGSILLTPGERQRAAQLEHHFRTVCQRFVFALDLNGLIQEIVDSYSRRQLPAHNIWGIQFQAECLADD